MRIIAENYFTKYTYFPANPQGKKDQLIAGYFKSSLSNFNGVETDGVAK